MTMDHELSILKVWNMVPAARGVGFAQVIGTSSVVSYYCVLIALSIYYLIASCQSILPWTICHPELAVRSYQIFLKSGQVI